MLTSYIGERYRPNQADLRIADGPVLVTDDLLSRP